MSVTFVENYKKFDHCMIWAVPEKQTFPISYVKPVKPVESVLHRFIFARI